MKLLMVYALIAHILFPANDRRGALEMRQVETVEIESTWEQLTDTATITLPRITNFSERSLKERIKKDDEVVIELGYNGELKEEFSGFVSAVKSTVPVEIKCEDKMRKLKQTSAEVSLSSATLKDVLKEILPNNVKTDAISAQLGKVQYEKQPVGKILEQIKDDYGLYSYFEGDTLVVGKIYQDDSEKVNYGFQKNIIENNLTYRSADERKVKIVAKSPQQNGDDLKVEVGDHDGEENQLSYFGIDSKQKLKKLAEKDLEQLKVDGFEGDFTTFGIPYVRHGMKAHFEANRYPDRSGTYFVKKVTTTWDSGEPSFRRDVEIGRQA